MEKGKSYLLDPILQNLPVYLKRIRKDFPVFSPLVSIVVTIVLLVTEKDGHIFTAKSIGKG